MLKSVCVGGYGQIHGESVYSWDKLKAVVKKKKVTQSLVSETGGLIKISLKRKTAVCFPTHWLEQDTQTFCHFLDWQRHTLMHIQVWKKPENHFGLAYIPMVHLSVCSTNWFHPPKKKKKSHALWDLATCWLPPFRLPQSTFWNVQAPHISIYGGLRCLRLALRWTVFEMSVFWKAHYMTKTLIFLNVCSRTCSVMLPL